MMLVGPLLLHVNKKKLVLTQKQMILTGEWRSEHSFAGRNTQQPSSICPARVGILATNLSQGRVRSGHSKTRSGEVYISFI